MTFAPVLNMSSTRLFYSWGAANGCTPHNWDVTQAFINAKLEEDVYVRLPDGSIWKLDKALYGTKQAAAAWNAMINDLMENEGYKRSKKDPCVYFKRDGDEFLLGS